MGDNKIKPIKDNNKSIILLNNNLYISVKYLLFDFFTSRTHLK